jgi:hypothetical protein
MRHIEQPKLTETLKEVINPKNVAGSDAYKVDTFRELVEHVAKLAYLNKDHMLFFRGQGNDYKNRSGNSSFYPSIYRGDYLPQSELNYRFDILNKSSKNLAKLFEEEKIEGFRELKRKKLIQWSILQHYEVCGTPLMDFTQSLRVACSFAHMDNGNGNAYIFVFGLPYLTNRISTNSEQDLLTIRLLSICPPQALRPYFQEGYLTATEDITNEYESKSELDFKNRLIAKFEIPNNDKFWGNDFIIIPKSVLYPDNDKVLEICSRIKDISEKELSPGQLGEFLSIWSELEEFLLSNIRKQNNRIFNMREVINILYKLEILNQDELYRFDRMRKFRNEVVHKPSKVDSSLIHEFTEDIKILKNEIITRYNNAYKK